MTVSAAVVAAVAVAVVAAVTTVSGQDLRNVIITGFGELPYEPAPGWQVGGFFQSDVFPVDVNGNNGLPQTMDIALRSSILVEDPNEKKSTSDGTENNSAEDVAKSSSTNRQVSDKNNSLDQDKAKEIEDELLTARTKSGLKKLNGQRDTQEKPTTVPSVPKSSSTGSQYRQSKTSNPPYYPTDDSGYNNREYYEDLGEGWDLEDADELLGGRNYNVLLQNPNSYNPNSYPKNYPPSLPPPRELPPPRFPPSSFYPFPGFGYKPFPPPPTHGSGRNGRSGYYRSAESRPPPSLREEIVYGRPRDSDYRPRQPPKSRGPSVRRVYTYYDDFLSGA